MPTKDGSQLEKLVKEIEERLLPEGFSVTNRERVIGEDGIAIVEFDIVIRGRLGSSKIAWLIECRDRPSQGRVGTDWIEQLVGRRDRFNFDKVFAVTTTGFTRDAEQFAKSKGITLRTVQSISEISSDFRVISASFASSEVRPLADIDITTTNPKDKKARKMTYAHLKLRDEEAYQTLGDFVMNHLDERQQPSTLYDSQRLLRFTLRKEIDMLVDGELIQVTKLSLPINIRTVIFTGKTLIARAYSEEGEVIAQDHEIELSTPNGTLSLRALLLIKHDETMTLDVTWQSIPEGMTIRSINLYGSEE